MAVAGFTTGSGLDANGIVVFGSVFSFAGGSFHFNTDCGWLVVSSDCLLVVLQSNVH